MSIQAQTNAIIGTAAAGAAMAGKGIKKMAVGKGVKPMGGGGDDINVSPIANGELAAKKAALARKQLQAHINNLYNNKELSAKAKTRRLGKIVDDYTGGLKDGTKTSGK